MAGFLPNLEDGERFLPSDIFHNERLPSSLNPNVERCQNHHYHRCPIHNGDFPRKHDLARQFTALFLLQQKRPVRMSPALEALERFNPPVRDGSEMTNHLIHGSNGVNGGNAVGQRTYEYGNRNGSVFGGAQQPLGNDFLFMKPTPSQIEKYFQARAGNSSRILQSQQNHLMMQHQNRIPPLNGGIRRESGGTGVFHPRIVKDTRITDAKNNQSDVRGIQRSGPSLQRNAMKKVGVNGRMEECDYHPPPRMGMSSDWRYYYRAA